MIIKDFVYYKQMNYEIKLMHRSSHHKPRNKHCISWMITYSGTKAE